MISFVEEKIKARKVIFIVSQSNAIVIKFLGTPHFLYKIVIKRLEMTVEHSVTGFRK